MFLNTQLFSLIFSLFATFAWGVSDFLGGYASRKTNAFLLTTCTHLSGCVLMISLALSLHAPLPNRGSILWAMAAGVSGGGALALFYRALSLGRMGLAAPVAALLGAAIPTVVALFAEGLPDKITLLGFLLAGLGIWLIARVEDQSGRPEGLGLAVISGIGFAGFFLCMRQAGELSPIWAAAFSRSASLVTTALVVLLWGQVRPIRTADVAVGMAAGLLDSAGTALFVKASQAGRLDVAVVISSLYPAITVLLARFVLREHFSRWRVVGLLAALLAVPMIAM